MEPSLKSNVAALLSNPPSDPKLRALTDQFAMIVLRFAAVLGEDLKNSPELVESSPPDLVELAHTMAKRPHTDLSNLATAATDLSDRIRFVAASCPQDQAGAQLVFLAAEVAKHVGEYEKRAGTTPRAISLQTAPPTVGTVRSIGG